MSLDKRPDYIDALRRSGLLSMQGHEQFRLLTDHVRIALDVPVSIISIVDQHRQVFAGHCGLPEPWASRGETPLSHSFCQYVVEQAEPLIISDARTHPLVCLNHAIADLGVIAYLGVPISLPGGEIVGALAAIDTEVKEWTERDFKTLSSLAVIVEREIAVRQSELKYRSIFKEMHEGFYIASAVRDHQGVLIDIRVDEVNPAFEELTGLPAVLVVGARLSEFLPQVMEDMMPAFDEVLRTGQPKVHSNIASALGGRWYENRMRRLEGDRIASIFTDVTERKSAEERDALIQAEMSHRLKNTISIVKALASQTLRTVRDRTAVENFSERLTALSVAHEILYRENWREASIADIACNVLSRLGLSDRIERQGPSVRLGARAAVSLSLIVHELATNAMKYGALSNDTGRVSIEWSLMGHGKDVRLAMSWQESGGPPVSMPQSKGFGSRLVQSGLSGAGQTKIIFDPAGFRAEMTEAMMDLLAD